MVSILFDLDGTLVDSRPGILASCEAALGALGHAVPDAVSVTAMIGPPLEQVMADLLTPLGDDRVAEAVLAYRRHYGTVGLLETTAYPGVADALDGLAQAGARLYVATSKRSAFARRILENLGLAGRFAAVYGSEPGGALDDKAALIGELLGREALRADRCAMVGDRRFDVLGAHAHGLASVGVLWGYGDRDELESAGARHVIDQPADLLAIAEAIGR